jgi:penicillin-binding protein 1B
MDMQRSAERAIENGLGEIERDFKHLKKSDPEKRLQSLLVAVKPQTGYIKAYIGGRDFSESQFDRITLAKRQAGSLFKPFVYLSAFELSGDSGKYTPGSILEDAPLDLKYDGKNYRPRNYDEKYFGNVTFRTALEKSLNSATVRLGHEMGEKEIVKMAKSLGITSDIQPYPSIALGSFEVTPWEVLQAYSVISNMGMKAYLLSIKDVVDKDGLVLEKKNMQLERIVSAQSSFLVNNILKGVFERGTAMVAKVWGFEGKVAGKTGTTDDYKDSWFVGYTPELLSLSWIGFDRPEPTGLTGAGGGLRVWVKFMKGFPKEDYDIDFRVPENIVFEDIDLNSGLKAGRKCQLTIKEAFIKGTEPKEKSECKTQ